MTDLKTILSWFQTGDFPTEEEFQQTFSSFRHKETKIPIAEVENLESSLNNKANIGDIPDNVALVDEGQPANVFNKEQVIAMAMMLTDYVKDGKIRADKIESLGLTDLIEADEKTLPEFVSRSNNYNFQQNDFIAIPVNGNFSLFMFKGGDKKITENYLPTGLTNITTSMVEGLQDALNKKLEKPTVDGNYFVNMSGNSTYKAINPGENHLLFWDGSNFKNSSIFRENGGLKFGIGTNTPNEQLHLTDRARMKALVLEDNSEALPQQLTYNNKKFYGTDSVGLKRQFQFADYEAMYETFNNMTPEQNLIISQLLNGGAGSGGNMSVNLISPPIVQSQYNSVEYITLQGANLNLSSVSRKIEILESDKTTVKVVIPDNQIQVYDNGIQLIFYYNFYEFTEAQYFIRLTSGSKVYITTLDFKVTQTVENVNLAGIKWNKGYSSDIIPDDSDLAEGADFVMNSPKDYSPLIKKSFKSDEIFAQGEDFYIEIKVNLLSYGNPSVPPMSNSFVGIGYSSGGNTLSPSALIYSDFAQVGLNYYHVRNNGTLLIDSVVPIEYIIKIYKTGNLFRTTIGNNTSLVTLNNNSGYSVIVQSPGRLTKATFQGKILKAFKFN